MVYDYGAMVPDVSFDNVLFQGWFCGHGRWDLPASSGVDYDLTVEVLSEQHPESTIEPFILNVRVDSTPPRLVVDYPMRAEMMQSGGNGDQQIFVNGTVS